MASSNPTKEEETKPAQQPRPLPIPIPAASIGTSFTSTTTNLSSTELGASVVAFSDEYFASAANLLKPEPAIRRPGVYVHTGAWYDGWETRRHNARDFDWVVVSLGCVGVVEGVEIDTAFFVGNEAPEVGLDGLFLASGAGQQQQQQQEEEEEEGGKDWSVGWTEILARQPCGPNRSQAWRVAGPGGGVDAVGGGDKKRYTHLRLKMYPDGGIARLRVYGHAVAPALETVVAASSSSSSTGDSGPLEELSSALNGGTAISCSDQHFGVMSNLLLPGRGKHMGDGWETARSRTEGHVDWVICRLGLEGRTVDRVVVDTKDFRGNFPRAVRVHGWLVGAGRGHGAGPDPAAESEGWLELVRSERACRPDTEHVYRGDDLLAGSGSGFGRRVLTHVKLTVVPDGGVKRFRVFGRRSVENQG